MKTRLKKQIFALCMAVVLMASAVISAHVEYAAALVHHYKAATIFQRKTQVVRDHEGGHLFFLHEFIRNAHHGLGGFRVECGGVLVED